MYTKAVENDTDRLDQSGQRIGSAELLEAGVRHLNMLVDYRYPNGEALALVNCQFDLSTHTVTHADLTNGRTPADDRAGGVGFAVRIQGLCL